MLKFLRKIILGSIVLFLMGVLCIYLINLFVVSKTEVQLYEDVSEIPANDVGLILGTNPRIGSWENPYFKYRIEAAAELYHNGKVKHFIVSGDNGRKSYNEPEEMLEALVAKGIPAKAITLDYAGFRTLDSIVRAKKVFQQKQFTIISQEFHNYRASYIANYYGIKTVAYNAHDALKNVRNKTQFREYFARVKVFLDLHILKTSPKFLGEKIDISV